MSVLTDVLSALSVFCLIELCGTTSNVARIVHGKDTPIEKYPHSAYLAIHCHIGRKIESYGCGGSVLNQLFILTAAHCLESCDHKNTIIAAAVGTSSNILMKVKVLKFKIHPEYNEEYVDNDIGVLMLREPLKLGKKIKRVVLAKKFPKENYAVVSGWGVTDEVKGEIKTDILQSATQRILPLPQCYRLLHDLPENSFCTEAVRGYAADGDSGSGLVINDYIQIGIVSCKRVEISRSVVMFTNVTSFYNWITKTVKRMSCKE